MTEAPIAIYLEPSLLKILRDKITDSQSANDLDDLVARYVIKGLECQRMHRP